MARSGKPHVNVLCLAVLVVTICLHGAHMVAEAGVIDLAGLKSAFRNLPSTENLENLKKVTEVLKESLDVGLKNKKEDEKDKPNDANPAAGLRHRTPVVPNDDGFSYVGVTGIKVGGAAALDVEAAALVSSSFPLTFLNAEAYELLKAEVSNGRKAAASELGAKVEQPCYLADGAMELQAITLVFAGGAEMKAGKDRCWYEQSDGSVCLAVLRAPWASGETVIGTMLQQNKMVVVGENWTF